MSWPPYQDILITNHIWLQSYWALVYVDIQKIDNKHLGTTSNLGQNAYFISWKGDFVFHGKVYQQILVQKQQYLANFKAFETYFALMQ